MTPFDVLMVTLLSFIEAAGDLRTAVLQVDAAFAAAKLEVTQWLK